MSAPTLFDTSVPAPAPAGAARPLVIGLDVAMGTSGVAGVGWTANVRCTAKSQHIRFAYQLDGLATYYRNADFVVIEGAAYSKNNQGADALAAMRWMIRHDLWKRRIPYAIVPPDQRVRYMVGTTQPKDLATGKRAAGNVLKGIVRSAVAERYGIDAEGSAKYDEADAYVMLAMGLDWLGYPLAPVPPTHARAMAGVAWPTTIPAVAR